MSWSETRDRKRRSTTQRNAQTELGCSLVLLKLDLPFCERERREDARDGTPLGDAQSGLGETRDAPYDDDRENESGGKEEPVRHCGRGKHGKLCVRLPVRTAVRGKEARWQRLLENGLASGRDRWACW